MFSQKLSTDKLNEIAQYILRLTETETKTNKQAPYGTASRLLINNFEGHVTPNEGHIVENLSCQNLDIVLEFH